MAAIDYLVVEFPGSRMTGEGRPLLVDLVDRGIIRILDFVFVRKELDGSMSGVAIADLDQDGKLDLAVFEGASSGLLDQDDVEEAGGALEPGSSASIPIYETCGRRRLPPRFDEAALNWSREVGFRCKQCWPQSMPLKPRPKPRPPRRPRPESSAIARREQTMPGLLRGVARTAVVAGTATAVSNRVSRRQAGRWAEQEQAQAYQQQQPVYAGPPPTEPANDMDSKLAQLKQLGQLKEQGVLTDAEFEAQKTAILNS